MLKREYIDLRVQYLTQGQVISVGIQELVTFWHISNKQVQRRLQLYATEKLLIYKPGHGRGHLSRLTFLHDFREEITTAMAEAMRHSDHATILYLFQLAVPSSWLADYRQI
ncbi:SgrR family transcriptional regulator, partial [Leuconostoc sp.]